MKSCGMLHRLTAVLTAAVLLSTLLLAGCRFTDGFAARPSGGQFNG